MSDLNNCGCCSGVESTTPLSVNNRPGLDELRYRIGTHSSFFESMLARLTTLCKGAPIDCRQGGGEHLLRDMLTTRKPNDPAIAMLDAWSTVADILTFYQERIANEGFLRTATEQRSLCELSRLVGYRPRPGVSASVFLAFEVESPPTVTTATGLELAGNKQPDLDTEITIPKHTQVKSTPAPGTEEMPQVFETSQDFCARPAWNNLRPRLTALQDITQANAIDIGEFYFKGVGLRLSENDFLALVLDPTLPAFLYRITSVVEDGDRQTTHVVLKGDELAVPRFISDLEGVINTFLSNNTLVLLNGKTASVEPTYERLLANAFRNSINKIRLDQSKLRLSGIDESVRNLIHRELLTDSPSSVLFRNQRTLRHNVDMLVTWSNALRDHFHRDVARSDSSTTALLRDKYQTKHQSLVDLISELHDALIDPSAPGLIPTLEAASTRAEIALEAKKATWTAPVSPMSSQKPDIEIGSDGPTVFASNGAGPIAPTAAAHVFSGVTQPHVVITATQLSGPAPVSVDNVPVAAGNGTGVTSAEITTALAQLQNQAAFSSDGTYRYFITVRKPADPTMPTIPGLGPEHVLGTFVQQANVGTVTTTVYDIVNEKIVLHDEDSRTMPAVIDRQFRAFQDPSSVTDPLGPVTFWAHIKVLCPASGPLSSEIGVVEGDVGPFEYQLTPFGSSNDQWRLMPTGNPHADTLAKRLQDSVAALTFRFDDPNVFHPHVQIQIFRSDPSTTTLASAACIRKLMRHSRTIAAVRTSIGNLVGELTTAKPVAAILNAFKLEVDLDPSGPPSVEWNDLIAFLKLVEDAIDPTERVSDVVQTVISARKSPVQLTSDVPMKLLSEAAERFRKIDVKLETSLRGKVDTALMRASDPFLPYETADNEAISTKLSEFREQTLEKDLTELRNSLPAGADLEGVSKLYDTTLERTDLGIDELVETCQAVSELVTQLARDLLSVAVDRRATFVQRLVDIRNSYDLPFRPSDAPRAEQEVKEKLDELLSAQQPGGLRQRITRLRNAISTGANLEPLTGDTTLALAAFIDIIQSQFETSDGTLTFLLQRPTPALTARGRKALQLLLSNWQTLVTSIISAPKNDEPQRRVGPGADVGRIVSSILGSRDGARSARIGDLFDLLSGDSDLLSQVAAALAPDQRKFLFDLLRSVTNEHEGLHEPKVYVLRSEANLFGWNAPSHPFVSLSQAARTLSTGMGLSSAKFAILVANIAGLVAAKPKLSDATNDGADPEADNDMFLDGTFKKTRAGSVVAVVEPNQTPRAFYVRSVEFRSRSAYGIKGNTTHISLEDEWWPDVDDVNFDRFRKVRVLCDPERLHLAEKPEPEILPNSNRLELDALVPGLHSGKWVAISGVPQRSQTRTIEQRVELFQILHARHGVRLSTYGDQLRTVISLSRPLPEKFWRDTVSIYANVTVATHGATQNEVVGSGVAGLAFQTFDLKDRPLTHLPAPTPRGTQIELDVHVSNLTWQRQNDFNESKPTSEHFLTLTGSDQRTQIVFGDGENGSRLPTGVENIRAIYRSGLGDVGNVAPKQIDQLIGAPLGVKGVINPRAAGGGADPDGPDQIRSRTPLGLSALERIVSESDYADFARAYGGIGKATASRILGMVQLTVAGMDSAPLALEGQLLNNLVSSLRLNGDALQLFQVLNREVVLLLIRARVAIQSRYEWKNIELQIREALYDRFSYERSEFGRDVLRSDAISVMVDVEGVDYVDVDVFSAVAENEADQLPELLAGRAVKRRSRIVVNPARIAVETSFGDSTGTNAVTAGREATGARGVHGAELCFLTPDVPDTLILEQIR